MSFSSDLAGLYGDFSETVTINGSAASGIFDGGYSETLDVAGTRPTLRCIASAVVSVNAGATVIRNGVTYTVRGKEPIAPDELETRLILERA